MKNIKILGTGCAKCNQLYAQTEDTAKGLGVEYTMEKVTELREIMRHGVMVTPALVVDGVVKVAGRVPGADELKKMLA